MIRVLFATYGLRSAPLVGPTMIGALKRCLRLVKYLPGGALEAHWIHSGPRFEDDPLVREMSPRLRRHDLHGRELREGRGPIGLALPEHRAFDLPRALLANGMPYLYMARGVRRLLARIRPDVVVVGDNPLAGVLRVTARAARERGIPVVAVDDYLSPSQPVHLRRSSPDVSAWFLVGLPFEGDHDRLDDTLAVAPPMLPPPSEAAAEPCDLTILGYDPRVARLGLAFLARLPRGTRGRLIGPGDARRGAPPGVIVTPPPSEPEYRACLEATRVVFCKNGFQQIVESLALGVPIVTCEVKGGVPEIFMADAFRPFVTFLPDAPADWSQTLAAAGRWLAERPAMPWREIRDLAHPGRRGSELFLDLLERVARGARERVRA